MSVWEPPEKLTTAWGESMAERLWDGFLSRQPVEWPGARVLDFGCSWGYLPRFLRERQGVAEAYGVDIHPLWDQMSDGARPAETPGVHLYAGDVIEIPELQDVSFDVVLSIGTLNLIPPTQLHAIMDWFYDRLEPSGVCLLRVRTFLSHIGGDLQRPDFERSATVGGVGLATPLPHLLFPARVVKDHFAEQGWNPPHYMNPSCAASYLMLFRRAGFEILAAERQPSPLDPSVYQEHVGKLEVYDSLELRTADLLARLRKPEEQLDIGILESPAETPRPGSSAAARSGFARRKWVSREAKDTQRWGRSQAEALWDNLFARYGPVVDAATVLDLGCSWGYLLKFLADEFKPRRLIGTDIEPWWDRAEYGWDHARLGERIEFHAGDLPSIGSIPDESVDLILCTSVLQYMTPEQLEANMERAYELLRPGGEMLVRTRVFTSYIGADLHRDIELPYVHLLHGERDLALFMRARRGKEPPYLNWLTASTYLAIFMRSGFEVLDARRRMNKAAPEVMDRVGEAFPWIAPEELLCAELEARLLRPIEPEELGRFT
jgi:cyclopropane fatty-acyl-phospholipid synthase-like methyltransferase